MCGIVGIIKKHKSSINHIDLELFKEMLIADAIRGEDSTGAFYIDNVYNVEYAKSATQPFHFLRSQEYIEFSRKAFQSGQVLVGHNRKATEGNVTNNNAHPFVSGPIVLVHNGNISNFRTLVPIRLRERHSINVDSHAVAHMLAAGTPEKVIP